jgi:hypothetical protein
LEFKGKRPAFAAKILELPFPVTNLKSKPAAKNAGFDLSKLVSFASMISNFSLLTFASFYVVPSTFVVTDLVTTNTYFFPEV